MSMSLKVLFSFIREDLSRLSGIRREGASNKVRWINLLSPRFIPVLIIRLARFCYLSKLLAFCAPILTWINVVLFGVEVTPKCAIGPGLMLPHTHGTVIGAGRIGAYATIYQGVTIGAKFTDFTYVPESRPIIEDEVTIGAGAKILGTITIGCGARVAANSLVVESVEPWVAVMGVPATIKKPIRH